MALTKLTTDLNRIQSLNNQPNAVDGLTPEQVKAKFDEAGNAIKTFVNDTLTTELDVLDGQNVKKTGNQTIQGIKTFESSPIVPTPTADMQTSTKKYVDDKDTAQTSALTTHKSSSDHDTRYRKIIDSYTKTETDSLVAGVVLGQIPNNSLSESKMANDMKKDIEGGVTSYNNFVSQMAEKAAETDNTRTTTSKTVTGAINELNSGKANNTDNTRTTTSKTVTGAINELNANKVASNNYVANSGYAVTTGTSTAYAITLNPAPTAYADGQQFIINPHVDCGANPTLNINSLGASTILKQDGSAIASGDIKANKPLALVRVGSNFFIRSSGGGSNIKSFQSGTFDMANLTSTMINISSVNTNNTIVRCSLRAVNSGYVSNLAIQINLVDSTRIQLSRGRSTANPCIVYWEVIEFNNVKTKQVGTFTSNINYEENITITPVNINKCLLFASFSTGVDGSGVYQMLLGYRLKDLSTITVSVLPGMSASIHWQLLEFN